MRLAMCLFKFFPYGGLERDFLKIANVCLGRGYSVTAYVMKWEGDIPNGLDVQVLPAKGWQNHTQVESYINKLIDELDRNSFDLVVGFNKMPRLDVYYAADVCYVDRMQGWIKSLSRMGSRYKTYSLYEKAVFSRGSKTVSLMISTDQMRLFKEYYKTPDERMILLPPGISKDRLVNTNSGKVRAEFRKQYKIADDDMLLLMVGSGFKTKGVDRAIKAVALLKKEIKKRVKLFVVGGDKPEKFKKMARKLGISDQVYFWGGRDDVPAFLLGADLLLQPSRHENTGTAIIEGIVSGLPVLVSDVCGYADHVEMAKAGKIIPSPFVVGQFSTLIEEMLTSSERQIWKDNALRYAKTEDLYSMPEQAVNYLEKIRDEQGKTDVG